MDLLLKFPSREIAVAFGQSLGVTMTDRDGENHTASRSGDLTLNVIGVHQAPTGKLLQGEYGEEYPETAAVPGWWVLARAPDDYLVPSADLAAIGCEIVWSSTAVDEGGEAVLRPTDPGIPQNKFS